MLDKEPVILGRELAAAHQAEAERLARNESGVSPLGPLDRYDEPNNGLHLYDPVRVPLDERLTELCRQYKDHPPKSRKATRQSLSMDDFYTLFTFARRAAVFAWRAGDLELLNDGLTAISMLELARVDWRDALGPPFVIYAICHQLELDPTNAFENAASLAEPRVAELLLSFGTRPAEHQTLGAAGYAKVDTPRGPGLISKSISPYNPTLPLDHVALQLAQLLRDNGYTAHAEIATELPDVWLSKVDDRSLSEALRRVVAGASVHATPFPTACPDYASQGIMVFLVESTDLESAQTLGVLANQKQRMPNDFVLLPVQSGRLFCLFVARNYMVGGRSTETQETMNRFIPSVERILQATMS